MRTLFFLCSGLGLGNASRIVGVLQALRKRSSPSETRIVVFAWGRAIPFLRSYSGPLGFELKELFPYRVRLSGFFRGLAGFPGFVSAYVRNSLLISREISRFAPCVALHDSDYHFLPFLFRGVAIVSLGQAHDVWRRARSSRGPRWNLRSRLSLFFFEKVDAFIQRAVSSAVLVPAFEPGPRATGKVRWIPLIVREEFLGPSREAGPRDGSACVLLSGSGLQAERLIEFGRRNGLRVFGSGCADPVIRDGRPCIDDYEIVLTQGGLSSISECLARGKSLLVFPMQDHAEQRLNAAEVEKRALGARGFASDLDEGLERVLGRVRAIRAGDRRPDCRGSHAVTQALLELAYRTRSIPRSFASASTAFAELNAADRQ